MRQAASFNVTRTPLITVIELWPRDIFECRMCGKEKKCDHAVGYYCGFTRDPIGSVTTEYTDGGIVGGMSVCKSCHDKFWAGE